MGPTWGRQGSGVSHVGPMNLAIWEFIQSYKMMYRYVFVPILLDQSVKGMAYTEHGPY